MSANGGQSNRIRKGDTEIQIPVQVSQVAVQETQGAVVKKKRVKKRKKKVANNSNDSKNDNEAAAQINTMRRKFAVQDSVKCEDDASCSIKNKSDSSHCVAQPNENACSLENTSNAMPQVDIKNSPSPMQEENLNLIQKLWLEVNDLVPLKKRYPKHPNAIFRCRICQYFCRSMEHCEDHIQDEKHRRNCIEVGEYTTLVNLPYPSKNHVETITELLESIYASYGISEEEKAHRKTIASEIDSLINENLPGCKVRLYGSSITGYGLKTSNVNLDFQVAKDLNAPSMLKSAYSLLCSSDLVTSVSRDFQSEIPTVSFRDKTKQCQCVLSLNSHDAYKTSEFLAKYESMDQRVKILGSSFRYWAQLCRIDDYLMGLLPSYAYNLMLVYFLQQIHPPVLPVLKDCSESGDDWKSTNKMSPGELWVCLFRFYAIDHPNTENVVCIRSQEHVKRSEKNWTGKKIAIEDPYLRKRNVSRYIIGANHEFICDCFKNGYRYFGIPQMNNGPVFALIRKPLEEYRQIPEVERNIRVAERTLNSLMDSDARFMKVTTSERPHTSAVSNMISVSELEEKLRETSLQNVASQDIARSAAIPKLDFKNTKQSKPPEYKKYCELVVSPKLAEALCSRLMKEHHTFHMDQKHFTRGKSPPKICNICQQEGHTKRTCPDNYLPELQPLPAMNDAFLRQLDAVCYKIVDRRSPTDKEIEARESIVSDLEVYLKGRYATVKLELFGSSCNGFGFRGSDLDICLTFTDNKTGENINFVSLIEELVQKLKAYGKLTNLIPITTAKVPIVKFTYPKSKLDCDISLYNTLAQRNTSMLRMYSQIDPRVKILGFTMKHFAKLCEICDASRGSLSSYAYILMVIYFLQQCDPPVLPVLQQLYTTEKQPEVMVEGWNTWFYDNLDNLGTVWPHLGKCTATVGELWLRMLRFYTEDFDFNEHVVCIRQKEKLLRFEKLWNSKCMAIEDPFDLSHNLGSGLSRKMNNFIIKAFRKGRMHFGTPILKTPPPHQHLLDYLLDKGFETDGQPPNDRGCRICKKIGHICKDCPQRKNGKKRQTERRPANEKAANVQAQGGSKSAERSNVHNKPPAFRGVEGLDKGLQPRMDPLKNKHESFQQHQYPQPLLQQQVPQIQKPPYLRNAGSRSNDRQTIMKLGHVPSQRPGPIAVALPCPQPANRWPGIDAQGHTSSQRGKYPADRFKTVKSSYRNLGKNDDRLGYYYSGTSPINTNAAGSATASPVPHSGNSVMKPLPDANTAQHQLNTGRLLSDKKMYRKRIFRKRVASKDSAAGSSNNHHENASEAGVNPSSQLKQYFRGVNKY